jgi:isoleucyl-tRNA synthetase
MRSFSSWGVMANWTKDVYFTTNRSYEAKQIELFWRLYERGLIYRDLKPVYWSPSSQTSLAEAELEYNSAHRSTAIYASFPIRQRPESLKRLLPSSSQDLDWFGVIWTTTPWSIPANQAIAFNPEMRYMLTLATRNGSKAVYIIGEDAMNTVQQDTDIEFLAGEILIFEEEKPSSSIKIQKNINLLHFLPYSPLCEQLFLKANSQSPKTENIFFKGIKINQFTDRRFCCRSGDFFRQGTP